MSDLFSEAESAARRPLRGYLLLFGAMALVGIYVALSRPLTAVLPVFLLAWLRFAIAALAMLHWLAPAPGDAPIDRATGGTLFVQSLFGNFLFSICMLLGVSMSSATDAGLVLASMPAVVALMSWLWLRETLTPQVWFAVALSALGVGLLALAGKAPAGGQAHGLAYLLLFASVCCESVYVILGKRLSTRLSPRRIAAIINLIGLGLMTPLGLWQAVDFDFTQLDAASWALLVFYALAASMFSTWLWLSGLRHIPASRSGIFTIAMPLAATTIGIIWLGEQPGALHGLALLFAIAAIALIAAPGRRSESRSD